MWVSACVCVLVRVYLQGFTKLFVSCMEDHNFLPTTTWLCLKIKAASHNEVCHWERHYSVAFSFSGCCWENAISCYLTLHHQTQICYFLRENDDKTPHFTFHTNQPPRGISASSFQWNILSLLQSWYLAIWSGGHSREGTVSLWSSLQKINLKPPYSEAELWHFTQWPFPLAGALANYLTCIQSLCVCHPHTHRLAWSGWLQM